MTSIASPEEKSAPSSVGTALITGASSGVGREYARLFAADGHAVVLVARRLDRLEELARALASEHGVVAHAFAVDLADPDAAERIAAALDDERIEVDYLVNNAGCGVPGPFADGDFSRELAQVHVNVTALTGLTHRLVPGMRTRRRGRILNVASTAAFLPSPYMAVYAATKAYVVSFSQALAAELAADGITVTAHCPGSTMTELELERNRLSSLGLVATAADCARDGYAAMWEGKPLAIHGVANELLVQASRLSPNRLRLAVSGWLHRA